MAVYTTRSGLGWSALLLATRDNVFYELKYGGIKMRKFMMILMLFSFYNISSISAHVVEFQGVYKPNVDLNSKTTLGQLTINPATSGKVIVHFDGKCVSDVGDRIVLAASNSTSWGINDGSVSVQAVNDDLNRKTFSHTRVYEVEAGSHTFYAVAQNYVKTAGSGIASIYGSLSVEFIPEGDFLVGFKGITEYNIDLNSNSIAVGEVTINPRVSGKAIVRFDGNCISDVGDRIILGASNTTNWGSNDGSTSVEAISSILNKNMFSHTRVYNVEAGSQTFYAVAQNFVEYDGSGIASIYGSLTVEFIPDGDVLVGFEGILKDRIDLKNMTTLGEVAINPTTPGKVIVCFNGNCISDVGDRIVLAASDTASWEVNDGNVSVEAYSTDIKANSFSHTRVYDVAAGNQTFYAVAQNFIETDGSGIAYLYGSLTVKFIPESMLSGIKNNSIDNTVNIYPNPTNDNLFIEFNKYKPSFVEIINSSGQLIQSFEVKNSKTQIKTENLTRGLYFVKIKNENGLITKKVIKQ